MIARVARGRAVVLVSLLAGCGPAPTPAPAPLPAPTPTVAPSATAAASPVPAPPPEPAPLSEAALRAHVEALAAPELRGRGSGTEDEAAAAALIIARLKQWSIAPAGDDYLQTFKLRPDSGRESANIIATLPGRGALANEVVVFGAHYDHLGVRHGEAYLGAEDNASGVAAVLEGARALATESSPRREVLLVFFGAEEIGLVGSRYYAEHPVRPISQTVAMVNVDMIGRPIGDREGLRLLRSLVKLDPDASLGVLGTADRPVMREAAEGACATEALQLWATEDFPAPIRRVLEAFSEGRGDSFSFEDVGVPALFFGAGESDDYHRPTDTPDKLHYPLLTRRARAITDVVRRLATSRERPRRPNP